jgi:hypothetical protein
VTLNSKEYSRQYYLDHKDKCNQQTKQYYLDHINEAKEYHKQYYLDHKDPVGRRSNKLKRKYGMTLGDYNNMLDNQGGGCAICGSDTNFYRPNFSLPVDHDHETDIVRGILCDRCNKVLGHIKDNIEIAQRIVEYLNANSTS